MGSGELPGPWDPQAGTGPGVEVVKPLLLRSRWATLTVGALCAGLAAVPLGPPHVLLSLKQSCRW